MADKQAAENQAMRPASYALAVAAVICTLGVAANVAVPSVFAALGGWLTIIVILFLVSLWAGMSIVRRTNRNVARMEDRPGTDG